MCTWGSIADIITALATTGLALGVYFVYKQFRSAESMTAITILFKLLDTYKEADFLKEIRLLSKELKKKEIKSLSEFEEAFKDCWEQAEDARRKVKFVLLPFAYLLVHKHMKPLRLFQLVPAAIDLWEIGLKQVEYELLKKNKREDEYKIGRDAVSLVDELVKQYKEHKELELKNLEEKKRIRRLLHPNSSLS